MNRAKSLAALASRADDLIARIEPKSSDDKLGQATKDRLTAQAHAASALVQRIKAAETDPSYDVDLGSGLPADLDTVQKACAKT
ncbi:hypothetical protein BH11MYX1_BH11MYX1_50270 [soil metagenome]